MMATPVTSESHTLAASLIQWWSLAGVDVAVSDTPRGWLAREPSPATPKPETSPSPAAPQAVREPKPVEPAAPDEPVAAPMPDTLDAFMHWLADDPHQPESRFSATRILPRIASDAELLVITDAPTAEDMAAGRLFSGADHRLLTGMLRAIGVDESKVALTSLLLARPSGGIIEDTLGMQAATRLTHFLGLANVRRTIIFGDGTNRALQQVNGNCGDASSLSINHGAGSISAMLLPAPFVLLKHAERKAAAWVELRRLAMRA